jgi:anthranilate synthase component 2
MILVVDNYDSFTYNLVDLLATLGAEVLVRRSDAVDADEVERLEPAGIVVSPGPCGPGEARNAPDIVRRAAEREIPVLGVCLGHQIIGHVFGATVARAPRPMHGKTARVNHDSRGVFTNVPAPLEAGLYHSLAILDRTLPPELQVSARSDDGVVMGIRHRTLPIEGVQFHPESVLTPEGETIVSNFLRMATHPTAGWRSPAARRFTAAKART